MRLVHEKEDFLNMYKVGACTRWVHVQGGDMYQVGACIWYVQPLRGGYLHCCSVEYGCEALDSMDKVGRQPGKQAGRQASKQENGQAGRLSDWQADRQAG